MLSVVIATLNDEENLIRTLMPLVPAAATGLVREVVVSDGGSRDGTRKVAEETGALFLETPGSRGARLAAGAQQSSRGDWLMFLQPGTMLQPGWMEELQGLVERAERAGRGADLAAVFNFAVDDFGWNARLREWHARIAAGLILRPNPSQGLVLSRNFYRALGGFSAGHAHPERALIRGIGRGRLVFLRSHALVRAGRRPMK